MSTLKPTKKISRRHELRQDAVVTAATRIQDLANRYRTYLIGAVSAIVVVAAALAIMNEMNNRKQARAELEMAAPVRLYEAGDFQTALDGINGGSGLLEIASDFRGTASGNLAAFYAGDALFRLGRYDEALVYFEMHDAGANQIGASAIAGAAAVYEVKGEYKRAADLYVRAAEIFDSPITSPLYLSLAGGAFEEAGDASRAIRIYERVQDDYPDSAEATQIEVVLARAQAATSSRG